MNDIMTKEKVGGTFTSRLCQLQKERGIPAEVIADEIRVAPSTVSAWRRGDSQPFATQLANVAQMLDTSSDYLLGLTDDPTGERSTLRGAADTLHISLDTARRVQRLPLAAWSVNALYSSPEFVDALAKTSDAIQHAQSEPEGTERRLELNTVAQYWVGILAGTVAGVLRDSLSSDLSTDPPPPVESPRPSRGRPASKNRQVSTVPPESLPLVDVQTDVA